MLIRIVAGNLLGRPFGLVALAALLALIGLAAILVGLDFDLDAVLSDPVGSWRWALLAKAA
ncbi:MAG: hypothetical protein ACHQ15_03145 [Candidatus Limnocylindrales bacterium]